MGVHIVRQIDILPGGNSLITSLNKSIDSDFRVSCKGGEKTVKRVKSACILQTLIFSQKDDCALSRDMQLKTNRDEVAHYKEAMEKNRIRYQIAEETEQSDGSVLVKVKKQYNGKTDVSEYFN